MRCPQRKQKKHSIMVVCEGAGEKKLWLWLKRSLRDAPVSFPTIENAKGGDACKVVEFALRRYKQGGKNTKDITHIVVMLDSDKRWDEAKDIVKKHKNMRVILCRPRFEHFLMKLRGQPMPHGLSSEEEKKYINEVYGNEPQHIQWDVCAITCRTILEQCEFKCIDALIQDAANPPFLYPH